MPNQYSAEVMQTAIDAGCSERTVRRYLEDPNCVNANSRRRIEKALQDKALRAQSLNAPKSSKQKRAKASKRV